MKTYPSNKRVIRFIVVFGIFMIVLIPAGGTNMSNHGSRHKIVIFHDDVTSSEIEAAVEKWETHSSVKRVGNLPGINGIILFMPKGNPVEALLSDPRIMRIENDQLT